MTPVTELISVRHTDLYIDGGWRPASDGQRIDVTDPATAEVIATVASASVPDALKAVEAADRAFRPWAARPPRERAEMLRKTFELMMRDQDKLAELMVRENGKTLAEARGEVAYAAEFFRWFSEEAVRNIGSVSIAPSGANRILVEHQPIGVSVLVTPWNFPAAMATRKIGPALAAGCTVVLKPASETPLSALAVADLLEQAGVPKGVVNVIPSKRSSEVVKAMLKDPRVRKLSFTGSTEVGRILLAQAAENVISCSMELGGNAPFIVLDDADLDAALEGAMIAKMRNTGQSCIAANRFYVDAKVADKFGDMLARSMGALLVGSGLDTNVKVGPVINDPARQKMLGLVQEAAGHGARVLTGGTAPNRPGYFVPPTVLSNVAPEEHILKEEIFGPIAPIVTFRDIDQAIGYANKTERGLASYVYTRDRAKDLRVAEAAGAIAGSAASPKTPPSKQEIAKRILATPAGKTLTPTARIALEAIARGDHRATPDSNGISAPATTRQPRGLKPSGGPLPNVRVNDPGKDSNQADQTTQSETSIAVANFNVAVGYNDSQRTLLVLTAASNLSGVSYSTDGGQTFTDGGTIPNAPAKNNFGDPWLATDSSGAMYYSNLVLDFSSFSLLVGVAKSTDGGKTWSQANPITPPPGNELGYSADKDAMVAAGAGNLYDTWDDFTTTFDSNTGVFTVYSGLPVAHSTDGSGSWSIAYADKAVLFSFDPNKPPDCSFHQYIGAMPLVAADGTVYEAALKFGADDPNCTFAVPITEEEW